MIKRTCTVTNLILAIILSLTASCRSGDNTIQNVGEQTLMILDSGWTFRSTLRATADSAWKTVEPIRDVHVFLASFPAPQVGWLHNEIEIPSDWPVTTYALTVLQSVASEIYLDGNLIAQFGAIDSLGIRTKEYDAQLKPIPVFIEPGSRHTLDVRIGLGPETRYTTVFEAPNPLFRAEIKPISDALAEYVQINVMETGFLRLNVGINIMLFIVHFFFYILNRSQTANLFLSLSGFIYIIGYSLQLNYFLDTPHHTDRFYLGNLVFFLFHIGMLLLFLAVHTFLGRKKDWLFWTLVIALPLAVVLSLTIYGKGWQLGGATYQIIATLFTLAISVLGILRKKKGAIVFTIGAIASFVCFIIFASMGTFEADAHFLRQLSTDRYLYYMFWWLSLTASVSAYLAWDFSLTSNALKRKLREVNDLSEKNMMMEKEKQEILTRQNQELEARVRLRTAELDQSLQNLKATQAQLIQTEKMASLGELTAGIAHEIQNPLNFVNNFSEINAELSDDIIDAASRGDLNDVRSLAEDIKSNQLKIAEHGRRADGIVKNMLLHSRVTSGEKESVDLNKLTVDYLNLAYHGFRAREKNFAVNVNTHLDPNMSSGRVVAQDIGRVLLNLINNALYALHEKKKMEGEGYQPELNVSTSRIGQAVTILIKDNGPGIPAELLDKIFQPFFTTKPAGQGTGLGLSLSYDIIKAHGGEIRIESSKGEGCLFTIVLPA